MKKIITAVLLMLAFHVNAQELTKFRAETLNNILNQYKYCEIISQDYAVVSAVSTDDFYLKGVVDYNGNVVLPVCYKEIGKLSDGMAVIKDKNNKYGYVNEKYQIVIPCKYTKATPFYNGKAVISNAEIKVMDLDYIPEITEGKNDDRIDATCKFINKAGQADESASPKLKQLFPDYYDNGFCCITTRDSLKHIFYIDSSGKVNSISPSYEEFHCYQADFAIVSRNDKYGIVTNEGKMSACIYDNYPAGNNYFVVSKSGKKGLIDKNGVELFPCEYEDLSFNKGNVVVKKNNRYGVLDIQGRQILPFNYTWIQAYNSDLFRVEQNVAPYGGYVNRKGELFFKDNPEDIYTKEDWTIAKVNNKYYAMDSDGETRLVSEYPFTRIFDRFAIIYDKNFEKYGVINYFGAKVLPCEYDDIDYEYGLFSVRKNNKRSYVECVDVQKLSEDFSVFFDKANEAAIKQDFEEIYTNLKKADEKLAELELYPQLYSSEFSKILKENREQLKKLIEAVSEKLKNN